MTSRSLTSKRAIAVALMIILPWQGVAHAAPVALADQPVFASNTVPGNLALALSVEWPTASRTAHTDTYTPTTKFLGYFDPEKCYTYRYDARRNDTDTGDTSYFQPAGAATNRTCSGKWSGNFLNWAATATIDPFRWAMTGGRRVVDTPTETILEKGWHSGQGLFDDRSLPAAHIAGATPFASASAFRIRVNGMGFRMRFALVSQQLFTVKYWNSTDLRTNANLGNPNKTDSNVSADKIWSGSPRADINADNFSTQFTGTFVAPATGNYRFSLQHDDGARLYVNGTKYIDSSTWTSEDNADVTGNIFLTAGQSFSVRIDQWDTGGGASVVLKWRLPDASNYVSFSDPFADIPVVAFSGTATPRSAYDLTMRVKVCDPSAAAGGVETNCKQYSEGWKPEGLVQKYANDIRFSAFGYLNDSHGGTNADPPRDGGVLRAAQKFVGPTQPVPGQAAATNAAAEWNATTGQFNPNPDGATSVAGITISNSGVMNYLNKFGQLIPGSYKSMDPVNELYYAALRYFSNQGNVPSWSDMSGASTSDKRKWLDGFPIVTNWADPILYSCQRNFILGIGDIYTHRDKNVPGNTLTEHEPVMPTQVAADTLFNAVASTNNAKALQGMGSGQATVLTGSTQSTDYMAGLAFEANTKDLRSDMTGVQTVQTYWVDVLEQSFSRNNKFYLAAKYGGLKHSKLKEAGLIDANDAITFDAYTYNQTIPLDWWSTNGEILTDTRNNSTWARPDNYFAAGKPDTLVAGLTQAFADIASNIKNYTTSLSLSTAQPSVEGEVSYAAQYDSANWSGVVSARGITFNAEGVPTVASTPSWTTRTTLESQLGTAANATGWDTNRRVATWNPETNGGVPFRLASLSDVQKAALNTSYVTGDDSANYLKWLRGDASLEGSGYRARSTASASGLERHRLGDIVNSRVTPVGPPSDRYADTSNPGYSAFKEAHEDRPLTLYVGANDGMLHAFRGGTGAGAGTELFAYVPSVLFDRDPSDTAATDGLLAQLGRPQYAHRNYVDATALSFDIDFARAGRTPQDGDTATSPEPNWRTVLIGGLGKGGRIYYALDITDPTTMSASEAGDGGLASKVLWEFPRRDQLVEADGGTCTGTNCVAAGAMGYTFGNPVVVKTKKWGWVAVFGSGYNNADGKGHLFIVNPANGNLLEQMSTGTVASNGMAHPAAYVQDYTDFTADAVYVGDLNGQLWRFDISGTGSYPAPTKIAQLNDGAGNAQPITTQPLVQIHPKQRKRYVLVGTGRLLDSSDIVRGQVQSFYGIADGGIGLGTFGAQAGDGQNFPATRPRMANVTPPDDDSAIPTLTGLAGWYINLGVDGTGANAVNWRVISPSTAYSSTVAFSTTLPTGDACNPSGKSRVYAMNFGTGQTALDVSYVSVEGVVTDLNFLRVGGKTRLIYGTSKGEAGKAPGDFDERVLRKLLNWREILAE